MRKAAGLRRRSPVVIATVASLAFLAVMGGTASASNSPAGRQPGRTAPAASSGTLTVGSSSTSRPSIRRPRCSCGAQRRGRSCSTR